MWDTIATEVDTFDIYSITRVSCTLWVSCTLFTMFYKMNYGPNTLYDAYTSCTYIWRTFPNHRRDEEYWQKMNYTWFTKGWETGFPIWGLHHSLGHLYFIDSSLYSALLLKQLCTEHIQYIFNWSVCSKFQETNVATCGKHNSILVFNWHV